MGVASRRRSLAATPPGAPCARGHGSIPSSESTRVVSAPSSGALTPAGRARGCATGRSPRTGRVGPVRAALTADIDTSRSQRPPDASACRHASAAVRPVTGSARASAQNSGAWSFQTTRPPAGRGVVAERDPVCGIVRTPVAGDRDPDAGSAAAHEVGSIEPELGQCARPARLDDDVGPSDEVVQDPDTCVVLQVQSDGPFGAVHQVEELVRAPAAPSGRCVDSTFTTRAPARARRSPHSGPAQSAERSRTTMPLARGCGGASPRDDRTTPTRSADSPTRAAGSPRSWALAKRSAGSRLTEVRRNGGPHRRHRVRNGIELEPRRNGLHVFGPRQRDRHEAVGHREKVAASSAARGSPAPEAHQRSTLAQERQRVQAREGPGKAIDPLDKAVGWPERLIGKPGQRHGPALCPTLHPRVVHCRQGNVSRSSNSSAPTHCSPSCAATSALSAVAP